MNRVSRCTFPRLFPSRLRMLRFLKKRWKKNRKPETLTYQATVADCGRDSDGEYLSGELIPMKPMGLIKPRRQISTVEGVLGSQLRTGRPEITSFLCQLS